MKTIYRYGTKRFRYLDDSGHPVSDKQLIAKIKALRIPPAWEGVEISGDLTSKVLAIGYDNAGRKQYIYNPEYRAKREKKKFDRIIEFANALPKMRKVTAGHLRKRKLSREKVLACMVRLIDQAYFRVGSERYAKENNTYGLATMRSRHLNVEGEKMIFQFVGKSGKEHIKEIKDPALARIVSELDDLPGYEIFKYYDEHGTLVDVKSDDLNLYIKEIMGREFSAKDFRTWAGTLIAAVALAEVADSDLSKTASKRKVTAAIKDVAEKLGNTPSIAKASYIDPRVIGHYLSGRTINSFLDRIEDLEENESEYLSREEIAVIRLLRERLEEKKSEKG